MSRFFREDVKRYTNPYDKFPEEKLREFFLSLGIEEPQLSRDIQMELESRKVKNWGPYSHCAGLRYLLTPSIRYTHLIQRKSTP